MRLTVTHDGDQWDWFLQQWKTPSILCTKQVDQVNRLLTLCLLPPFLTDWNFVVRNKQLFPNKHKKLTTDILNLSPNITMWILLSYMCRSPRSNGTLKYDGLHKSWMVWRAKAWGLVGEHWSTELIYPMQSFELMY